MADGDPGMTRREFCARVGRWGLGAAGAWWLGWPTGADAAVGDRHEVDYYKKLSGQRIQCFVCPLNCILEDGETCPCRTRTNRDGTLYSSAYNNPCILRVDPIEKMPLNHFLPGTQTLSLATGGCMMRCLYCQNWEQSQERPERLRTFYLTPAKAVAGAKRRGIATIAFTYTEVGVFLEWATDVAREARRQGLNVVAATSAYLNPKPLRDFARHVDGFVVTLKGFTDTFYRKVVGCELAPVLEALKIIHHETRCWLEVANLIVPTYNDRMSDIRKMCLWIKTNLSPDVPLHFERFYPMYKLRQLPRTSAQTLEAARRVAQRVGLRYVYTSNIAPHEGNHTYCPKCRTKLIERLGFKLLDNRMRDGRCRRCGAALVGRWSASDVAQAH